jgi:hypothetical protein
MNGSFRIDVSDVKWLSEPFPEFVSPAASPVDPSPGCVWLEREVASRRSNAFEDFFQATNEFEMRFVEDPRPFECVDFFAAVAAGLVPLNFDPHVPDHVCMKPEIVWGVPCTH